MKKPLTNRQTEVLNHIKEKSNINGYVTTSELIESLQTSQPNVDRMLRVLREKGWIVKDETHYPVIYKTK